MITTIHAIYKLALHTRDWGLSVVSSTRLPPEVSDHNAYFSEEAQDVVWESNTSKENRYGVKQGQKLPTVVK